MSHKLKIAALFSIVCFVANAQQVTIQRVKSVLVTNEGVEFTGKLVDKKKDLYMFPKWKNTGAIHMDGKTYRINNLNLNVTTNAIESRVKDKFFIYQANLIDSVTLNNRSFKRLGRTFYEVLVDRKENMFLKKFDSQSQKSKSNRLGGTVKRSRKLLKFEYLIKEDDQFKKVELNKKSILETFADKKDELLGYAKSNKLSFKKEEDMIKILNFMFSQSS